MERYKIQISLPENQILPFLTNRIDPVMEELRKILQNYTSPPSSEFLEKFSLIIENAAHVVMESNLILKNFEKLNSENK